MKLLFTRFSNLGDTDSLLFCHKAEYREYDNSSIQAAEAVDARDDNAVPVITKIQTKCISITAGLFTFMYLNKICCLIVQKNTFKIVKKIIVYTGSKFFSGLKCTLAIGRISHIKFI